MSQDAEGLGAVGFGIVLIVFGFCYLCTISRRLFRFRSATATLIRVYRPSRFAPRPVYTFETPERERVLSIPPCAPGHYVNLKRGKRVRVLYNPSNPRYVVFHPLIVLWVLPTACLMFGICLLWIGYR